jgi:CDP-glucose 4,6-dehydratase
LESLAVTPAFWRSKRVLLTGHTGFKGAWLALWLHELGARVTGYSLNPPSTPSLFGTARLGELVDSRIADIRDLSHLAAVTRKAEPEVVFHLAAQSLVRPSYDDPVETFSTNVMGTVNLLEAVRHCPGVKAVVVVTSDKCYENRNLARGYVEGDPLGGHDPYSSSKACAEIVTAAYRRSFFDRGAAIASARAGNVIGGGDWAKDRLLPDMVRAFGAGQAVRVRNPDATRPWQHVLDPLAGYLGLAERLVADGAAFDGAWNFGPESANTVTVAAVVEQVVRKWGGNARWEREGAPQPHEAKMLALDAAHARTALGWSPRLALGDAVDWTVDWYLQQACGGDARALTVKQIHRYAEAVPA